MKVVNKKLKKVKVLGSVSEFSFSRFLTITLCGIYVLELCHLCHKWHFSELLKYYLYMTLHYELNCWWLCVQRVDGHWGTLVKWFYSAYPDQEGLLRAVRWSGFGIDGKILSRNKLWNQNHVLIKKPSVWPSSDYF